MRKRVFKTFAAAALATTIVGTTIIGSTAFADEISTLTQQKQDKQNELDQLQQQAAYLLTEMSSLEQDMADLSDEIDRQVWVDGDINPEQVFDVVKEIIGIPTEENSTQYLMDRGCSSSALTIYSRGTAVVTGGYPIGYSFIVMIGSIL